MARRARGWRGHHQPEMWWPFARPTAEPPAAAAPPAAAPEPWEKIKISTKGQQLLEADGWDADMMLARFADGGKEPLSTANLPPADKVKLQKLADERKTKWATFTDTTLSEAALTPVHVNTQLSTRDLSEPLKSTLGPSFVPPMQPPSSSFAAAAAGPASASKAGLKSDPAALRDFLQRLNLDRGIDIRDDVECPGRLFLFDLSGLHGTAYADRLQRSGSPPGAAIFFPAGNKASTKTSLVLTSADDLTIETNWSESTYSVAAPFLGHNYKGNKQDRNEQAKGKQVSAETHETRYHEATLYLESFGLVDTPDVVLPLSQDFKKHADDLLKMWRGGSRRNLLKKFRENFGLVYAMKVEVGGKIKRQVDDEQEFRASSRMNQNAGAHGAAGTGRYDCFKVDLTGGYSSSHGTSEREREGMRTATSAHTAAGADKRRTPCEEWSVIEVAEAGNVLDLLRDYLLYKLKAQDPSSEEYRTIQRCINEIVEDIRGDANYTDATERPGHPKWMYPTGGFVASSPTVSDGVVYVGSCDQKLYALDAKTGAKKWTYSTGGNVFGSPAVSDGLVYVGCWTRHKLHAVHAETSKGVPPTTRNRPLFIVPVTASVPV